MLTIRTKWLNLGITQPKEVMLVVTERCQEYLGLFLI